MLADLSLVRERCKTLALATLITSPSG